jgi:hypothetical protein
MVHGFLVAAAAAALTVIMSVESVNSAETKPWWPQI